MKKCSYIVWFAWCLAGSFLTPHWLTVSALNITGLIYQFDHTMDAGTAGIVGAILLLAWGLMVLLPMAMLLKKVRAFGNGKLIAMATVFTLAAFLCVAFSNWNTVEFWIR